MARQYLRNQTEANGVPQPKGWNGPNTSAFDSQTVSTTDNTPTVIWAGDLWTSLSAFTRRSTPIEFDVIGTRTDSEGYFITTVRALLYHDGTSPAVSDDGVDEFGRKQQPAPATEADRPAVTITVTGAGPYSANCVVTAPDSQDWDWRAAHRSGGLSI